MKIIERNGIKYRAITGRVTKEMVKDAKESVVEKHVQEWVKKAFKNAK